MAGDLDFRDGDELAFPDADCPVEALPSVVTRTLLPQPDDCVTPPPLVALPECGPVEFTIPPDPRGVRVILGRAGCAGITARGDDGTLGLGRAKLYERAGDRLKLTGPWVDVRNELTKPILRFSDVQLVQDRDGRYYVLDARGAERDESPCTISCAGCDCDGVTEELKAACAYRITMTLDPPGGSACADWDHPGQAYEVRHVGGCTWHGGGVISVDPPKSLNMVLEYFPGLKIWRLSMTDGTSLALYERLQDPEPDFDCCGTNVWEASDALASLCAPMRVTIRAAGPCEDDPSNTTASPSTTSSNTHSGTATSSGSPTDTHTGTLTATPTDTPTDTIGPSGTPTQTGTATNTLTASLTESPEPSVTQTPTETLTDTIGPSGTPTQTGTWTDTDTLSHDSETLTLTDTLTLTQTATPTLTVGPSGTTLTTGNPTATMTSDPTYTKTFERPILPDETTTSAGEVIGPPPD
jgi:hypothetical protein